MERQLKTGTLYLRMLQMLKDFMGSRDRWINSWKKNKMKKNQKKKKSNNSNNKNTELNTTTPLQTPDIYERQIAVG